MFVTGAFSYFMFAVILLSTTTFVLDTLPGLSDSAHTAFAIVETVTVQIFTADFVIRCASCCSACHVLRQHANSTVNLFLCQMCHNCCPFAVLH